MKFTLLLFGCLLSLTSFSQKAGDIVIFNNDGYDFHVMINGVMQNSKADSRVRVQELRPSYYKCKIMASDNFFNLDKNIIVKSDTLITYQVVRKRNKFKLRFYSEVPMQEAIPSETESAVTYHSQETEPQLATTSTTTTTTVTTEETQTTTQAETPATVSVDMNVSGIEDNGSGSTTTTMETQEDVNMNTGVNTGEENISISMNVGTNGASMNVSGTGLEGTGENTTMNTEISGNETYTQTTTTTTTVTSTTGSWEDTEEVEEVEEVESSTPNVDYNNCFVSEEGFTQFHEIMKNETFDEDKTALAKEFVGKKCLSVTQIGILMEELSFSEDRMTVAKAAFPLCYEESDYYLLTEKFTFSSDKAELRDFIEKN